MDSTARFSVFSLPTIKHNVEFCKPPPPRAAVIAPLPSWLSLARLFTSAISFHFIALFLSDTLALSHKLAWISRASEGGEECRVRGTKEKKRGSLSSQSEGEKKKYKKVAHAASSTIRRQSLPGASFRASQLPKQQLRRLMGVFSLLGCCSCGWFAVIRPCGAQRLMLPITRWQGGERRERKRRREVGKEMEGQRETGKRTRQRQGWKEEGQKERRSSSSAREKKKNQNFLVATVKHFLVGGDEAEKSEMLG